MKKALVLAALAALVATSAFAASGVITGSAHDLSGYSTNTDELCVYCHTPHGGGNAAPLWNRGTSPAAFTYYNSSTLNAYADPTTFTPTGDLALCMSCHDGDLGDEALINPPAGGQPDFGTISADFQTTANLQDGANSLTNDHPVGFVYNATLFAADPELHDPSGAAVSALLFNEVMWCSSCHDVHKPGLTANSDVPFLRTANTGSALCLTCHNK